ncbi:MAG: double-cubane-cluster-containing anaerobic reductase [Armatimonadetes bacterium]|nr:double-cubane-cluster-containing anaerobic reductase [Armatimonadota bacterium]
MAKCSNKKPIKAGSCATKGTPIEWFEDMIDHCYDYAQAAKNAGKPIVGIMCEYAPRELIMAAGGVPVCLCGGSAKTIPAAEEHLPSNLCPLIKSTYGYHLLGTNPFLEMADLIVAETTCDGKKKMFELMEDSRSVYLMELTQKQDDPDAFEHWVIELRKLKSHMQSRFNVEITPDKINEAIEVMNRERRLRRTLAEFMKSDNPPITGRQLLKLKSIISGIPADLEQYESIISHLTNQSDTASLGSRVRVLLTGVPTVHGAERVIDIIEDIGGLVVCMENCTGLKPIIEEVEANAPDPIRALAEKYFRLHCSVMTRNTRRMDYLRKLAEEYRAECIIDLIWQACITYDIESYHVRKLSENVLNLPYLRIETDYSPSDSARIAMRVEALYETARNGSRSRNSAASE